MKKLFTKFMVLLILASLEYFFMITMEKDGLHNGMRGMDDHYSMNYLQIHLNKNFITLLVLIMGIIMDLPSQLRKNILHLIIHRRIISLRLLILSLQSLY